MNNREIAAVLFNISAILSTRHANPYRIRAYRRAARHLLRMRAQVAERVAAGKPLGIPRLGKSLTEKISTLARSGELPFYAELCAELSTTEQTLLKVPGLGPTIAARVERDLGEANAERLIEAAGSGALQKVWGIGPKRSAAITRALGGPQLRQERLPF